MRHGEETAGILQKLKDIDVNPYNNPAISEEQRDFGTGAQILRELGISRIRLISNHPKKRIGLIGYGLEITENIHLG
jgi:3,4-dihydroxy 2-butanone 4-phosphate synthase/GTP cyclohydrolase II